MLLAIIITGQSAIQHPASAIQNPASAIQNPASGIPPLPLKFPWAGGLNSCQFCPIDLNLDGTRDLLIFDRHGNRKLTFINHGTPNTADYSHNPEYALQLPVLTDWVMTQDYNCDGKMDIFTYGSAGIRVFRNTSGGTLQFEMVTDQLESYYYNGKVGILVTSVDYPALSDIDGDGDTDLLTFFGLGSYLEYHKNLSMEKYGHCDSLDFRLADPCWGKFSESEGGNQITLNADCPLEELRMTNDESRMTGNQSQSQPPRHTGSTLLAIDLDHNGLKDLILGDVDYPNLIALYNGGTVDSALMVAYDTAFPATSTPVRLFSFPAVSLIDIDNDGLSDLLVSPFDPSLHTSDNYNGVWFCKNTGSPALPHFVKQPVTLFRNEMMDFGSGSHPVLYDFDSDGLQDLFVGNDGYYDSSYYYQAVLHSEYTSQIAFFRNTGTISTPVFEIVTDDLAGISSMNLRGLYPALGDLNGDGFPDLVTGNLDGTLVYFQNTGNLSQNPEFKAPVMNWHGIDAGRSSAPQLFDLDKDNLIDLIIGEQNGNLNYYRNTGTSENPLFSLITDSLGKVNVTNYQVSYNGCSTPCFSRQPDGTTFLLSGSDEGRIHLFTDIDNNLDGKFIASGGLFNWLSSTPSDTLFGWQTSPAIGYLTHPEAFDLVTGNFSGGLNYITKRSPAAIIPGTRDVNNYKNLTLTVYPNPATRSVTVSLHPSSIQHPESRIQNPESSIQNPASSIQHPESRLSLTNLPGQTLLNLPFNGLSTISVAHLPPGIYLLRVGGACAKLVIERP